MTHEEIQDRLEGYVDDRLTREERREVDRHLRDCAECRAILDDVAPVDLSGLRPMTYDEDAMRRTVRRSMFRSALNTALLLLAGWIVIWFLSALVVQPLLVNRGGRAADAVQASIDLGVMANPGAILVEGDIQSGLITREVDLQFALPVGAGLDPGLERSTSIGLLGIRDLLTDSGFDDREAVGDARDQLSSLGDGTVSTVAIRFETPLSVEAAQQIADDPGADVRMVWAGFDASLGREMPPDWTGGGVLGYGTCQDMEQLDEDLLGATSAGFSRGSLFHEASVERARQSVVSALENITSSTELESLLVEPFGEDPGEVTEVLREVRSTPRVKTLVITGPTPEVADFVSTHSSGDTFETMLAVDFYNWTQGICGR